MISFAADITLTTPYADILPQTQEVGMMCNINGYSFYPFTNNTLIDDSDTSCNKSPGHSLLQSNISVTPDVIISGTCFILMHMHILTIPSGF